MLLRSFELLRDRVAVEFLNIDDNNVFCIVNISHNLNLNLLERFNGTVDEDESEVFACQILCVRLPCAV